jgi:centromere protein C
LFCEIVLYYLRHFITNFLPFSEVVSYAENMVATQLPLPASRKKSEGRVVGKASQAFNVPTDDDDMYVGYIMGSLVLPPSGIKDAESSGSCSLSFTLCHAQPKSVEVAFGDPNEGEGELNLKTAQRFLLGPGDMFRVLPGNCYRLQNHSKTTECLVSWTIIRPRRNATEE